MRVECCSFSGNHSSMMLEIESMWDPEWSVSALGVRTWCSGFKKKRSSAT
jgi:hypothetical protein